MGEYHNSADDELSSTVYDRLSSHFSAKAKNTPLAILDAVRTIHPDRHITPVDKCGVDLVNFAKSGQATATLNRNGDRFSNEFMYKPPESRMIGGDGKLGERINCGCYDYVFDNAHFMVYLVSWSDECGMQSVQYIVTPKENVVDSQCPLATKLMKAAGKWSHELHEQVYVYDSGRWIKSHQLWEAVQSASWDDVILDSAMKSTLIKDVESFYDSRSVYEEYNVPWKRGIIFHGTPGCGKTITIKALMNSLQERNVASLYVKSFEASQGQQYSIRYIFHQARIMAPCLLIFEDLDSLVVDDVRSYFLNEVDGLENNDGILMIGSTNHLERLDPGISKRPSRFDRKYHYKLPAERERIQYCQYWREKLQKANNIEFSDDICKVVAQLTDGFSFAYLKELFVQTLLSIVGGRADDLEDDNDDNDDVENVAEKAKIVEGSGSLLEEGQEVESSTDDAKAQDDKAEEKKKKPIRTMPTVEIPEHLQSNPLMRVLHKQAQSLWKEMDNTSDEINGRGKISTGDE